MSLGGDGISQAELRATEQLAKNNTLLIAAAGNDGNTAISYPAGFASVVSVAAVDSKKKQASFSQTNADVELSAPGVDVESTVPIGSQIAAALTVGKAYDVLPMEGSPLTSASGPLADFGLGDAPVAGSMTGKVCLIQRGTITFAEKVVNCQNSGGVGAVVYNNTSGDLNGTLGTTVTTIPSVGTTQLNGQTLLRSLGTVASVSVFKTNDVYAFYSGTSMATPHVSGVAALVWSYFPACSAAQIRDSLDKSAQDLGDRGRDRNTASGSSRRRRHTTVSRRWDAATDLGAQRRVTGRTRKRLRPVPKLIARRDGVLQSSGAAPWPGKLPFALACSTSVAGMPWRTRRSRSIGDLHRTSP